jgi:integrase
VAHIQKRVRNGETRYRARYRTSEGREVSRTFRRKIDAQRWLDEVTADVLTGRYVDPRAGQVTLAAFAERWLEAQTFDVSTREAVASRLRVHIVPHLGSTELRNIRPSTVQAWIRGRQEECAPSYVRVLLANLSSILGAALADGLIAANPCASPSVKAPRVPDRRVVPWTREQVDAVIAAHPERYRAMPIVAAGCGLRQGEVFGVRVEDVDFLRRTLYVRQQVKQVSGRPLIAPPKGGKFREIPLPDVVATAIAERLRVFPADGRGLVFTSREGGLIDRNHYNPYVWKPALREAGVEPTRENGMHALRHHYASVLLEGGVSIRAVAAYLGHADPGFTLRTYTHLMPTSEDRTRSVVDDAFGPRDRAAAPARPGL